MKILTGKQIKEADRFTIENEPVESIALMERAAEMIAQAICRKVDEGSELLFLIGKGNNGGDGLAVARMLSHIGFDCVVCMVLGDSDLSDDCHTNYERLPSDITIVNNNCNELLINDRTVIIDAMLGSGMTGEIHGAIKDIIRLINKLLNTVISIDIPSGMKTEFDNNSENIVHADITLTLEFPKLAMLLPEAGECCGEIEILPIELLSEAESNYYFVEVGNLYPRLKSRPKFSHKGSYGHSLLICGSKGMTGAAILSTCGALRSGCGLVTTHLPENEASALHANAPSAMVNGYSGDRFTELSINIEKYSAIGVGCGLGTAPETVDVLAKLLKINRRPMIIDADALNIIASHPKYRNFIPARSILTPHIGEFKRFIGQWEGEEEKLSKLRSLAADLNCTIILKGSYTAICMSDGRIFFNSTGCVGMAKAGSGDILTGILTGILAQGYSPEDTALIGVWLHGRAGEKAEGYFGPDGMNSSDIIDFIPEAWTELR